MTLSYEVYPNHYSLINKFLQFTVDIQINLRESFNMTYKLCRAATYPFVFLSHGKLIQRVLVL